MKESSTIKICRVLCIFFMTYVHVNPGLGAVTGTLPGILPAAKLVLIDALGRASVPALSVISGFLAVAAYERRGEWSSYARDRWRRLVVPMIAWNAIFLALGLLAWLATGVQPSVVRELGPLDRITPALVLDRLTGYHYGCATMALNFLRDVFVCSLLVPVAAWLTRRLGAVGLGLIWLAGLTIGFAPVVMRPNILMFFVLGVFLAVRDGRLLPAARTALPIAAALLLPIAATLLVPRLAAAYGDNVPGTSLRLVVAISFLAASAALSGSGLGRRLAALEPAIYFLFLSHASIQLVFWGAWRKLFGPDLTWPYPVFYLGSPFAALLAAVTLHRLLVHLPPAVQRVLNGRASAPGPRAQAAIPS